MARELGSIKRREACVPHPLASLVVPTTDFCTVSRRRCLRSVESVKSTSPSFLLCVVLTVHSFGLNWRTQQQVNQSAELNDRNPSLPLLPASIPALVLAIWNTIRTPILAHLA